jgi:hypothetical protein
MPIVWITSLDMDEALVFPLYPLPRLKGIK